MYQLRYLSYLILSVLGGVIFQKILPNVDIFTAASWLMTGNILFEILEWKYNQGEQEDEYSG